MHFIVIPAQAGIHGYARLRHSRAGGNPWLYTPSSFPRRRKSMVMHSFVIPAQAEIHGYTRLRHSRAGGIPSLTADQTFYETIT